MEDIMRTSASDPGWSETWLQDITDFHDHYVTLGRTYTKNDWGMTYNQMFIHREPGPEGAERAIDYIAGIEEKAMDSTTNRIRKAERKAWLDHWNFFRPSNVHFNPEGHFPLFRVFHRNPLEINITDTMSVMEHKIKVNLAQDTSVELNASAYSILMKQVKTLQSLKKMPNYLNVTVAPFRQYVMPAELLTLITSHNWAQYSDQMKAWDEESAKLLKKLSKHPNIGPIYKLNFSS